MRRPRDTLWPDRWRTCCSDATAHHYLTQHYPNLTHDEKRHVKKVGFRRRELVQATARVGAMNLMLHGLGPAKSEPVKVASAPICRKSSTMIVGEDGKTSTDNEIVERGDFWVTTSNRQLNFVQSIKTQIMPHGRAAVGGARQRSVRRPRWSSFG